MGLTHVEGIPLIIIVRELTAFVCVLSDYSRVLLFLYFLFLVLLALLFPLFICIRLVVNWTELLYLLFLPCKHFFFIVLHRPIKLNNLIIKTPILLLFCLNSGQQFYLIDIIPHCLDCDLHFVSKLWEFFIITILR